MTRLPEGSVGFLPNHISAGPPRRVRGNSWFRRTPIPTEASNPAVPTENSQNDEKCRVLGRVAVVSPDAQAHAFHRLGYCPPLPSSGCSGTWRTSRSVTNCRCSDASGPGRLRPFAIDRLLWVWLYRLWPRCLDAMVLVKPATVVQWHRQGFRLFWRWCSRSGRPSVDHEIRNETKTPIESTCRRALKRPPVATPQHPHRFPEFIGILAIIESELETTGDSARYGSRYFLTNVCGTSPRHPASRTTLLGENRRSKRTDRSES
jgi:hypothetical protein